MLILSVMTNEGLCDRNVMLMVCVTKYIGMSNYHPTFPLSSIPQGVMIFSISNIHLIVVDELTGSF